MPCDGDEVLIQPDDDSTEQGALKDAQPVRRFTWKELSKLNRPHNAHVAVRGKVSMYITSCTEDYTS